MKKVGITGGIGSGKTTVCRIFETLGIPVFYADQYAKEIVDTDDEVIARVKELFGDDIYIDSKLDRPSVAHKAFDNPELLDKLNEAIHPAVGKWFDRWVEGHEDKPYVIEEAAILFESGASKKMDKTIAVYASEEDRINRVMKRDDVTREEVEARISSQMKDSEKTAMADFVIKNDNEQMVIPQVLKLHEILSR